MPPMTPADWHFPLRCTRCDAEAGHAFSVKTETATEVTVSIRCSACEYVWVVRRETPTLASIIDASIIGEQDAPD
jgi:hypothetical protein